MNNETSEKKDSVLKILAIAGFIGIIIIIAWASIQLVSVVPSAFSSLASLAESVNNPEDTEEMPAEVDSITVTSNTLLANNGESVDVSWDTAKANGSYVFTYECADGVAIDLVNTDGVKSIQCENNYNIGNVDTITLVIDSEKNRYSDIAYSISFLGTSDTRPRAVGNASFTVFNATISDSIASSEDIEEPEVDVTPDITPATSTTPSAPSTPVTPPAPEYVQEYTYSIPTSNPNGATDLATRYLFTGNIKGNTFTPSIINQEEDGAIQFEVKNLGTKTSKSWTYTVSLPGGGTYDSKQQSALKPNERVVISIGFPGADVTEHTFKVTVKESTDRNRTNDSFSQRVVFAK